MTKKSRTLAASVASLYRPRSICRWRGRTVSILSTPAANVNLEHPEVPADVDLRPRSEVADPKLVVRNPHSTGQVHAHVDGPLGIESLEDLDELLDFHATPPLG